MCDLVGPAAVPAPLFAVDEFGLLVYNSSRSQFWACPVCLGEGVQLGWSYYLDSPGEEKVDGPDMAEDGRGSQGERGPAVDCRNVTINLQGVVDEWICNHIPDPSLSSSVGSGSATVCSGLS